jgi:hypothetical protein
MSSGRPLLWLDSGRAGQQFDLVDYPIQSDGLTAFHGLSCRLDRHAAVPIRPALVRRDASPTLGSE